MALSILDGNQSATTLSTIVTSGQHIPAHTVVSLGTQAIANITSAISGTSVCVGSISISGTPSVTGSVSVLNFPASQSTTFGAVTGSVSVLNFPASQSVTFGATTGSVSILNFPASQAVTFGQAIVSASNITGLNNSVGTDGNTPTSTNFIKIGGHQDGSNQVEHIVHVSAGGSMKVDASDSTVTFGTITGTVTVGNSVTIGSCVTHGVTIANSSVTVNGTFFQGTQPVSLTTLPALVAGTAQIGSVTASISGTVPVSGTFFQATQPASLASLPALAAGTNQIGSVTASISGTVPISISSVTVGNSVTIGSLPAISGTVTANSSNGSLTTRFGSVTTANTALETSAVTNANRKYLLIQNITTASNVITVGIGFTPTTTQGIQLFAGAGLTFEGSYIPTGAVNLLSSVTASCYTILEA